MKRQKIQNLVLQKGIFIHFLVLKPHTSSMAVGALWVKLRTRIIMGRKSQGKEPTKARGQVSALRGWRAVIDVMMTPKEGQMGEMEVSRKGFYIGGGERYRIYDCQMQTWRGDAVLKVLHRGENCLPAVTSLIMALL